MKKIELSPAEERLDAVESIGSKYLMAGRLLEREELQAFVESNLERLTLAEKNAGTELLKKEYRWATAAFKEIQNYLRNLPTDWA